MAKKIFIHIPDDFACTLYRTKNPMLHLYSDLSKHGMHIIGDTKVLPKEEFDTYIFNRLIRPKFYSEFIEPSLRLGKKFVWQCDDNLWLIPEWNPALKLLDQNDLDCTKHYVTIANDLWISTNTLSKYVGHPQKTKILPNLVDVNQFDEKIVHDEEPIKIVWCGSASHHHDFAPVIEAIIKLIEKHKNKVAFIFWGYLPDELANFERSPGYEYATLVPKYSNVFYGEWFSNREYFHKLRALKPDIAIIPLMDCEFNHSRSNIKFLEMSMAGAACVASDLPPYECIKHQETGFKVKSSKEWYDTINELIKNKKKRLKINAAAIEQVRSEYSWQSPSRELWLNAFLDLLKH